MAVNFTEQYCRSADGLRLYARSYAGPSADAPVVLCLHGLTRTCRDFEDLAPHLHDRYRIIAVDFRGRGQSDRDADSSHYQPVTYVKDVVAMLEQLAVPSVVVIGTSLGGLVAMMLAALHRPILRGMVLNDVGPEIDPVGAARIRSYAGRLPAVTNWANAVAQAQAVYGAAWPGLDAAYWERIVRRGYRQDAQGRPEPDADPKIGEALRGAPGAAPDLWPLWAASRGLPTLVLRGAHSDILSLATLERMKSTRPEILMLEVPDRGHVPLLDEPPVLEAIDGFLASAHVSGD